MEVLTVVNHGTDCRSGTPILELRAQIRKRKGMNYSNILLNITMCTVQNK